MNTGDSKKKLSELASIIIHPHSNFGQVHKAVSDLYQLFILVGGYTINTSEIDYSRGTNLSTGGLAVSTSTAAKCMFDLARTHVCYRAA